MTRASSQASNWVAYRSGSPQAPLRLFCLPYAGGGASTYRQWQIPGVEVIALEPPGRARRFAETPLRRMGSLVEALRVAIDPLLDKPFSIFGHSLGGAVGFELSRRLRLDGLLPRHLVVSGTGRRLKVREPMHELSDADFVARLRKYNGAPAEVLDNVELMELMLPCVRADFEVAETHTFDEEAPLACPLTAFGGDKDGEVSREELATWSTETTAHFEMQLFPGDHFYFQDLGARFVEAVAAELRR